MGRIRTEFRVQGVEMDRFRVYKVGDFGSGSNSSPWILCSAVRTVLLCHILVIYVCFLF